MIGRTTLRELIVIREHPLHFFSLYNYFHRYLSQVPCEIIGALITYGAETFTIIKNYLDYCIYAHVRIRIIMAEFRRIPTGIKGLDEMVAGGFPFPSVALVAGSAGTGKTTFSMSFLTQGANKGEQGLFFTTLSEPTQWMLRYASQFDFVKKNFFGNEIKYEDIGLLIQKGDYQELLEHIDNKIAEVMPERIVIDPITVVGEFFEEDYRMFLFELTNLLKNWQAVTLLTGEVNPGETYPPEITYAVDSVVLLSMIEEEGSRRKYLEVLKMRGTDHTTGKQPISITTSDGIVVLKSRF